ncbi:hypothetical protein SSX86_013410 [Deinandra increscens subsp. villosa]|uniref:Nascent polypeptide-associated complex subunit alpha-like UBA domain-containing protein n=1 Tax=Deinandra increscens subsp. villosa TaxID=3103831 RepID=A0AAP0DDK7_9ASTR
MPSEPWILCTKLMCGMILMQLACLNNVAVSASVSSDEVVKLPGQPPVSFKQFAGYISVGEAKRQRSLFYYFVEAESNSSSKPLVLWLNGGPGCSSVGEGAFVEHGPFKPSGRVLVKNNYSWNKEANMLYLESPAGVGFSYSVEQSFYTSANDVMTAGDNLAFLENWFEKYPQYKNRDFYITGESYAGHYVPQLANLIVHSKSKINLKGIAIGNPLLDFNTDFNSRGEYLWSHGLISDTTYDMFNAICNYSTIRRQAQSRSTTPTCSRVANQASKEIGRFVNAYDITLDICLSNVFSQSQVLEQNFLISVMTILTLQQDEETKIDVCVEDEMIEYLNRKDVQTALNARLVDVNTWTPCSEILSYEMDNLEVPMTPILVSLLKSGIRILVYSGDQDSVLPLTGTRVVVNGLAKQLGLNITLPYRAWFNGNQVGGWTQVYGEVLSFATIRGASHEAPFSQPERSLALFRGFLAGKPLPPGIEIAQKPRPIPFRITKPPDVFKNPLNSDTSSVVFGEAKIQDLSLQLQGLRVVPDDEDVDDTGVHPKDIELVMTQASVSRPKAVRALKAADGDIVSAIMELTYMAQGEETGMDPRDIELVMIEARVSRSEAVRALKAADGDMISAIMELTYIAWDDENVDEAGMEPKDIELVMTQASVSRPKAVRALQGANGDIVSAIMELITMARDDEDVDETRVHPKDIELVMTQADVSRSKAVRALKDANGDIVSAIMELITMARDDEDVDETGVHPKDIELVMTQADVSRSKAVRVLQTANGDIVTAIMELITMVRDDEDIDETGVHPKDIELVMIQAAVSRSKAVRALRDVNGDIVSAIMELT